MQTACTQVCTQHHENHANKNQQHILSSLLTTMFCKHFYCPNVTFQMLTASSQNVKFMTRQMPITNIQIAGTKNSQKTSTLKSQQSQKHAAKKQCSQTEQCMQRSAHKGQPKGDTATQHRCRRSFVKRT